MRPSTGPKPEPVSEAESCRDCDLSKYNFKKLYCITFQEESEMATRWCLLHGIFPKDKASKLVERLGKGGPVGI